MMKFIHGQYRYCLFGLHLLNHHEMKKIKPFFGLVRLVLSFILLANHLSFAQCPNDNQLWFSTTVNCDVGLVELTDGIYGGEYLNVTVASNKLYTFSTCGDADFDTQLTLYDLSGNFLAYNDNYCGLQSQVSWLSTFDGTIRVLVDRANCVEDMTQIDTRLMASCESQACPTDNNQYPNQTFDVVCDGNWNALGDFDLYAGEFRRVNVVNGNTYSFRLCDLSGYATSFTLRNTAGDLLDYNIEYCETQMTVSWDANFNGEIDLHLDLADCSHLVFSFYPEAKCELTNCGLPIYSCSEDWFFGTTNGASNDKEADSYSTCYSGTSPFDAPDNIYALQITVRQNIRILLDIQDQVDLDIFLLSDCGASVDYPQSNQLTNHCLASSIEDNLALGVFTESINLVLDPGIYYVVVDGHDANQLGDYFLKFSCECTCTEDLSGYLPFGNSILCENFKNYDPTIISPQSTRWRKWSTTAPDGILNDISANQQLQIVENGSQPDVIYKLDDLSFERIRLSWDMTIAAGGSGYYNVLHDLPEDDGEFAEWAYYVYFLPDGSGELRLGDDPDLAVTEFNYVNGQVTNVMQILDPFDDVAELWINHNFVYRWDFSVSSDGDNNELAGVNFFAIPTSNYSVDDICLWKPESGEFDCLGEEPVCIENGQFFECQHLSGTAALYTPDEYQPCYSVCDQGGELMYLGDNFTDVLESDDLAPPLVLGEQCILDAYGGQLPADQMYADIYTMYYDQSLGTLGFDNLMMTTDDDTKYFMFGCDCSGGNCEQICYGEVNEDFCPDNPACSISGFFYFVVLSPVNDNYGFDVTPSTDCTGLIEDPIIACGDGQISGDLDGNGSNFSSTNGDYASCADGTRTYEGNDAVYRIDIEQPTVLNITLNGAEPMGAFLYDQFCGANCLLGLENSDTGGLVVSDSIPLAEGVYYIIVDKAGIGGSETFTLDISCDFDDNFIYDIMDISQDIDCPVDVTDFHGILLEESAYDFSPLHYLSYNVLDANGNLRPIQGQNGFWNFAVGQTIFQIPKDDEADPAICSYVEGDSFLLYLYDLSDGNFNGGRCEIEFNGEPDGEAFYESGGNNSVASLSIVEVDHFSVSPNFFCVSSLGPQKDVVISTDQSWEVFIDPVADWLSVDDLSGNGPQLLQLTVEENETPFHRASEIDVVFASMPPITRRILVRQKPNCDMPNVAIMEDTDMICVGDTATLEIFSVEGYVDAFNYQWSPNTGDTSKVIAVSPSTTTTYTVTVTNKECTRGTAFVDSVTINVIDSPDAPIGAPDETIICSSDQSPTLSVTIPVNTIANWYETAAGGTLVFQGTSFTPPPLGAGTYIWYVESEDLTSGCNSQLPITPVTLIINEDPIADAGQAMQLNCNTTSLQLNGNNSAASSGGVLEYSWTGPGIVSGANSPTPTVNAEGTYTLAVSETPSGCTATANVEVTSTAAPVASISNVVDLLCFSDNSGAATVVVANGSPPFNYLWCNGQTTATATGLSAGLCAVTVTDDLGCVDVVVANVGQADELVLSTSQIDVLCAGETTGQATVNPTGGTGSFTYLWCNGQTTQTATGLGAGICSVTVTDNNLCPKTTSVNMAEPQALSVSLVATDVECNGDSNGSAMANVNGGTLNYSFLWNTGATTFSINNLTAGPYSVTITDGNDCTETASILVGEPPIIVTTTSQTSVTCNGINNGTATVNPSGGVGSFTYLWCNGQTSQTATNLPSGPCSVTVTDANTCSLSNSVSISEPDEISISIEVDNITCFGENDGTATANPTGGIGSFTYQWCNGQTTQTATGLGFGDCSVTVTDANGCSEISSTSIDQAEELDLTISSTNVSCAGAEDGTASVDVSGGTLPYSYLWCNGQTSPTATGLPGGACLVVISDGNNCTMTEVAIVSEESALSLTTSSNDVSCFGEEDGTAVVSVSGGSGNYSYLWCNGDTGPIANDLPAGDCTLMVTDDSGCTQNTIVNIGSPNSISLTFSSSDISCFGGSDGTAAVAASGGNGSFSYLWCNTQTTPIATGLPAGACTVMVTDTEGCTQTGVAEIQEPDAAISISGSSTPAVCGDSNGTIHIIATGGTPGYSYNWSPFGGNTPSPDNLPTGLYTVTVTDQNDCTETYSISVDSPNGLSPTFSVIDVTCNSLSNGAISLTVTGGTSPFEYEWDPNVGSDSELMNLTAGTYDVTITDADDCEFFSSATVSEPAVLNATQTFAQQATCGQSNGSVILEIEGGTAGYSCEWSNGSTDHHPENLAAGTYTVTITDANGCTTESSAVVTSPEDLAASFLVTEVSCNDGNNGSIEVNMTGGTAPYDYNWSHTLDNTSNPTGLEAGDYFVTVTDSDDCTDTLTITVDEPAAISITDTVEDASCGMENGTISLITAGGTAPYSYNWSGPFGDTPNPDNVPPGTYFVTVTDAQVCGNTFTIIVGDTPLMIPSIENTIPNDCYGDMSGSIDLGVSSGTAPYTYVWSGNAGTDQDPENLAAGTYTVTITDTNNCTVEASATVFEPDSIAIEGSATSTSCEGDNGSVSISVTGGTGDYTYLWMPGESTEQNPDGLPPGDYIVLVTDALDCTNTFGISVNSTSGLDLSTNADMVTCPGSSNGSIDLTVNGGVMPYTYEWNTGATSEDLSLEESGNYTVTVIDATDCSIVTTATIESPDSIAIEGASFEASCTSPTGSIEIEIENGVQPYTFLWSNNSTDQNPQNLLAGAYEVTVTDGVGCIMTASFFVGTTSDMEANGDATDVLCHGSLSGSIDLTVTGGTSPFIFEWSSGDVIEDPQDVAVGEYIVTVTDNNGCIAMATVVIEEPDTLVGNLVSQTIVDCFGEATGTATIEGVGGVGPYDYSWSTSGNTGPMEVGLSAGTYQATITDAHGCTATQIIIIEEVAEITFVPMVDNACAGECNGAVTLEIEGGTGPYTFELDSGNQGALCAGDYALTISDANGCTMEQMNAFSVEEDQALLVVVDETTAEMENGTLGTADITISGGIPPYSFEWVLDGNVVSTAEDPDNLEAGDYVLSVIDANDCQLIFSPIMIEFTTSIFADNGTSITFEIIPNPSTGVFQIAFPESISKQLDVKIVDVLGRQVYYQNRFAEQGTALDFDVSKYAAGVYFVQLSLNGKSITKRVVIQQ